MRGSLLARGWRIALALALLAGCGQDELVVARVGDRTITRAEFQRFVERLPAGLRSGREGRDADLDHLQSIVDQELLLLEARTRGVDTSATVRRRLERLVQQRLIEGYRSRVIAPRVEVEPEDVERAFAERGFNRERLFSRILVRSRRELEEVGTRLGAGRSFEEVAQGFAGNDLFAREGNGLVGWIGRLDAERRYAIPPQIFATLPAGQVAEPVRLAGGWQVYRFVEDREAEIDNYWVDIENLLAREQLREREEEEFEVLKRRYEARLLPEGVAALLGQLTKESSLSPELPLDQADRRLCSFAGGEITVGEGLASLRAMGLRSVQQDSAHIGSLVDRLLLHAELFAAAGRQEGWDQEPEFVDWRERKTKELVLNALVEEMGAGTDPTEEEIRTYYEANKDRFRTPEEVFVHEAWTATEEEAAVLRQELEQGGDIAVLLDRPGVKSHADVEAHSIRDHAWELRLLRLYRPRFPELVDAAFAAGEGELVGPIKSLDGYAVFRVLRRKGGEIQPFEQARRRALAALRKRRENELMMAFIQHLQEKYRDQVEFFADRLDG